RWLPCPAPRWSKVWPTRSAEPWPRPPDASAPVGGSAQSRPVDDVVDERGVEVRDHIIVQGHGGLDLTLCFGDEQWRVVAVGIADRSQPSARGRTGPSVIGDDEVWGRFATGCEVVEEGAHGFGQVRVRTASVQVPG